jgi:chromosome segregation ATPase
MKRICGTLIPVAAIYCLCLTGCVTKGKFLLSQEAVGRLESDSANTHRQLCSCQTQVKNLQDENGSLQKKNAATERDLQNVSSTSKMTIADQAKRLKDLQNLIQSQRDAMNKLKKSIADALVNFKPDELSV